MSVCSMLWFVVIIMQYFLLNMFIQDNNSQHGQGPELKLRPVVVVCIHVYRHVYIHMCGHISR